MTLLDILENIDEALQHAAIEACIDEELISLLKKNQIINQIIQSSESSFVTKKTTAHASTTN